MHAASRGLTGLPGSLGDPGPEASLPSEVLVRAPPGRPGKDWVLRWLGPLWTEGASTHARPGSEHAQRPEAGLGNFSQR